MGRVRRIFVWQVLGLVVALIVPLLPAAAQTEAGGASASRQRRQVLLPPAEKTAVRAGATWRVGPIPAWVQNPPQATKAVAETPNVSGWRLQLFDVQQSYAQPKAQVFIRNRSVALDAKTLGQVSQPQIQFNPAFQTVIIHHVRLVRDGRTIDRLTDARIESMRREQRLEQQIIDGNDTLLVVVNDVRVGEPLEVAYTIEGVNPIFEGKVSGWMSLAHTAPIDVLHQRLLVPRDRTVKHRAVKFDGEPEVRVEGNVTVMRVVREQVPPVIEEVGTPPWVQRYPGIDITEYSSWQEVDAWARRLFSLPTPTAPSVTAKAAELRATGLQGAALVSETLRFVQDEVRYFSVALGESSHRPKAPDRTLAERLGDCKDKVVLFNALLRELGFQPQPALVSIYRNRRILDLLPSPDLFDHVITRLDLDGRTWYLDPTVQGAGLALESRGRYPYGAALVVGADAAAPERVPANAPDLQRVDYEQIWDLSEPGAPTRFSYVLRASGSMAEALRAAVSQHGPQAVLQQATAGYARVLPKSTPVGEPTVTDDRARNVLEVRHRFDVPEFASYAPGVLEAEFAALELFDVLTGPPELQRRTPYMVDQPALVHSRIEVRGPLPFDVRNPPRVDVSHRQFRYAARADFSGAVATFTRTYERIEDEVSPEDLAGWREKIMQARQASAGRIRLPLVDVSALRPEFEQIDRRMRSVGKADDLQRILLRNEVNRLLAERALARVKVGSTLAGKILEERAVANNLVGAFDAGLRDADAALVIQPGGEGGLDARGVALIGLGRAEEALRTFSQIKPATPEALTWMGSINLALGRAAEAEGQLREALGKASGEGREFTMIWLSLAAEQQGRGSAEATRHAESVSSTKLTGAILRHLAGQLDADALIKRAREHAEKERLDLAEAYFYIGQRLIAQGKREEARAWMRMTMQTQATPYRELSFARLALEGAKP